MRFLFSIQLLIHPLYPQYAPGVPIEVSPAAYAHLLARVRAMDSPDASLRMAKAKAGPVVTDNGNFVIDAPFGPAPSADPKQVSGREIRFIIIGSKNLRSYSPSSRCSLGSLKWGCFAVWPRLRILATQWVHSLTLSSASDAYYLRWVSVGRKCDCTMGGREHRGASWGTLAVVAKTNSTTRGNHDVRRMTTSWHPPSPL